MSVTLTPEAQAARKELLDFLTPMMSPAELKKTSRLIAAFITGVLRSQQRQQSPARNPLAELGDGFFNGREAR